MRLFRRGSSHGISLAFLAAWPGLIAAQGTDPKPIITAALLRRACVAVKAKNQSAPTEFTALCELDAPTSISAAKWDSIKPMAGDLDDLKRLAAVVSEDEWVTYASTTATFEQGFSPIGAFAAGGATSLNASAVLWGFTDFFVSRGEAQLRTFVVSQVLSQVCAPDAAGTLLPASCKLFDADAAVPGPLPSPSAIRASFRTDLARLPANAIGLAIVKDQAALTGERLDGAYVARYAAGYIGDVMTGHDPEDAVRRLIQISPKPAAGLPFGDAATPVAANVYRAALLYASLGTDRRDLDKVWPTRDIAGLYAMKAYVLNLLHDRPYSVGDATAKAKSACVVTSCSRLRRLSSAAHRIAAKLDEARALHDTLMRAAGTPVRAGYALRAVVAALDGLREGLDVMGDEPSFQRVTAAFSSVDFVARSLVSENYASATLASLTLVDSLGLTKRFSPSTVRVLTLASNVAQASDASGVKAALDDFVAPARSYLYKRNPESVWYWSINGYFGASGGTEAACPRIANCGPTSAYAGAYVPLGAEIGWPISEHHISWLVRSAGIFVQLADLGTLASWRLRQGGDSATANPNVSVAQVFAPGAHAVFGLRTWPLVAGFGVSAAPLLRTITESGVQEKRNAIRIFSAFLAVDIPLFP